MWRLFRRIVHASSCLLSAATVVLAATTRLSWAQTFDPGCPVPFASIQVHHPIDDTCARRGDVQDPPAAGTNDAAHALQNLAKNNFCATGAPTLVTFNSFKKLQQKLDQKSPAALHWSRDSLPGDRSVFLNIYSTSDGVTIGEGNVVRISAWLMKRREGGEESCNCEGSTKDNTDIHVVLISSSNRDNTPECESVTAEISPHLRPENWDSHALLLAQDHPLRFTGQLMYDAAHRPCSGNPLEAAASAPKRISSWEIHPVYAIDVCGKKSLANCKANDSSAWTPLAEWTNPDQ